MGFLGGIFRFLCDGVKVMVGGVAGGRREGEDVEEGDERMWGCGMSEVDVG